MRTPQPTTNGSDTDHHLSLHLSTPISTCGAHTHTCHQPHPPPHRRSAPQVCEEGPGQNNDLGGIPIFRGIDLPEAYRHQYRDTNNTSFYGMRQARNISIFLHIVIRDYSPQQHQRGRQLSHHHGHDRHRHQNLSYECILLIVCPYIHTIEDQPQPLPEEHTATTTPLPRY